MRRLALWLAEFSDRWARAVTFDDGAEQLARVEEDLEVWAVDHGEFVDRCAPVVYLDEHTARRHAKRRHPAFRTP